MKPRTALIAIYGLGAVLIAPGCQPDTERQGTGTLKLLVSDKPFPFEFIKEANITITRVEVRRDAASPACSTAQECVDGDPCTADACEDGVCVSTPRACDQGDPCAPGPCGGPCQEDAECDDEDPCTADTCEQGACAHAPQDCPDPGDSDDGNPFIVIFEGPRTFNLLELQNGRTDLLADAQIPSGNYDLMRLIVTAGEVILDDEGMTKFPLTVPSGPQTGIKLHFEFSVAAEGQTTLLLDVDVSKAFLPVPGGHIADPATIREFKFKPSVAMKLIDVLDAGGISGTVTDPQGIPLANVAVTALRDQEDVSSTSSDEDGSYFIGGLATGTYAVEASANGFEDARVEDVGVQAGETTPDVDVTMQPVPEPAP